MDNEIFDCAIIGGGLAGLTLAIQLADAGHSVVLFEKEQFPFHKVCGEYISMESYDFLLRIGAPLHEIDPPFIKSLLVSAPNGISLTRRLDMGGFGISRYTLDAALAALAVQKGITLLEEAKVTDVVFEESIFTIHTAKGIHYARVACGAWGKRSALDKKLNRNIAYPKKNYMAAKYHVQLDFPADRIELHNFKDGYCGISRVEGGKYCLCYMTGAQNLRDNANDIKRMEQVVLMKNPFLKKYFSEAHFLNRAPIAISQITFSKKTAVENNMLMTGDAAGNIAPLCGNGMSMAMHASFQACRLISKYLNGSLSFEHMLQSYEAKWNELFSGRITAGRHLQYLFGRETLTKAAITILRHMPALTDRFIRKTHGAVF